MFVAAHEDICNEFHYRGLDAQLQTYLCMSYLYLKIWMCGPTTLKFLHNYSFELVQPTNLQYCHQVSASAATNQIILDNFDMLAQP
jgi:hypothetical protein